MFYIAIFLFLFTANANEERYTASTLCDGQTKIVRYAENIDIDGNISYYLLKDKEKKSIGFEKIMESLLNLCTHVPTKIQISAGSKDNIININQGLTECSNNKIKNAPYFVHDNFYYFIISKEDTYKIGVLDKIRAYAAMIGTCKPDKARYVELGPQNTKILEAKAQCGGKIYSELYFIEDGKVNLYEENNLIPSTYPSMIQRLLYTCSQHSSTPTSVELDQKKTPIKTAKAKCGDQWIRMPYFDFENLHYTVDGDGVPYFHNITQMI